MWQTNKTLHVQGSQDIVEEYEEWLSELISEGKSKSDSPEEITDTTKNDKGNTSNVKKANKRKGKKFGANEEVLHNGQVVKIWEVINTLKMSMISLTERFENMTETEGVDIIKELPQAQLHEAKAKIDELQSLNCALETESMELKNQVTRLIKNNYELAQCLKTFTEDDLKSQRRFDLAPQPPEPGSVHVPPADGHEGKTSSVQQHTVPKSNCINKDDKSHGRKTEEQKGENKESQPTKNSSLIRHLQRN